MKDWKEGVTREQISARLESWTDSEWEGAYENFMEYKAALGPEAVKDFHQFAWGIAAQNELYAALKGAQ